MKNSLVIWSLFGGYGFFAYTGWIFRGFNGLFINSIVLSFNGIFSESV